MNIVELLNNHQQTPTKSVPDWMLGCFKRRSISFANGLTDVDTHVFWLQSRNITIDLRLPIVVDQVMPKQLVDYNSSELHALANYEGWYAETTWENDILSWSGGTALQTNNRWPEPASLVRTGDCMMEFSPSNTYVEDWRVKSRTQGPLIGLRLIDETNLTKETIQHRDGALIINNDWAGLVLGRAEPLVDDNIKLRDLVAQHSTDISLLEKAFNFETSIATGSLTNGFDINFSTQPNRVNETLFDLDGFEFDEKTNQITHQFEQHDDTILRRFAIDTIEVHTSFEATTRFSSDAEQWFNDEQETLGRYLRRL